MTKTEEMQRLKAWEKNLVGILTDLKDGLPTCTPIIARSHREAIEYHENKLKHVQDLIASNPSYWAVDL